MKIPNRWNYFLGKPSMRLEQQMLTLFRKGMNNDDHCKMYKAEAANNPYALYGCRRARSLWL